MKHLINASSLIHRREILRTSALSLVPLAVLPGGLALKSQDAINANGGSDPFPIPWLDKNGSHNQPTGANLEPSHIYLPRIAIRRLMGAPLTHRRRCLPRKRGSEHSGNRAEEALKVDGWRKT